MGCKGTMMKANTAELVAWEDDVIRLDVWLAHGDLKDHCGDNISRVYALFDNVDAVQDFINRLQKQLDELKEGRG